MYQVSDPDVEESSEKSYRSLKGLVEAKHKL